MGAGARRGTKRRHSIGSIGWKLHPATEWRPSYKEPAWGSSCQPLVSDNAWPAGNNGAVQQITTVIPAVRPLAMYIPTCALTLQRNEHEG